MPVLKFRVGKLIHMQKRSAETLLHKPLLLDARMAHRKGIVAFARNGMATLRLKNIAVKIPPDHQFDLTQATIFGLNERLTSSATSPVLDKKRRTLRDEFNDEWKQYSRALEQAVNGTFDYGTYAYYEERNDLVRFCPARWHRVVSIASSSKLIADPKNTLSWSEIRSILENTTVAVAGASVGNNILHLAVMDLRPLHVKIADKSLYKMENMNRVRLGYWDVVQSNAERTQLTDSLLRNKALVTASQLYSIDPYLTVHAYPEGVHEGNAKRFFGGGNNEPAADIIIEEVDDPKIKIYLREEARRRGIPLLMASDFGSCVQLDVLRYDKNKKLSLTYETQDRDLRERMREVKNQPGNRKTFFKFVDALVGTDYRTDELKKIIELRTEIPTSTIIPQLGSTAAVAGGIMAEAIARIRLGYDYPPRVSINKKTFEVKKYS